MSEHREQYEFERDKAAYEASGHASEVRAPTEAEVRALEQLVRSERARAARIEGVADHQTGAIRGERDRKTKRKAAKAARRRNR